MTQAAVREAAAVFKLTQGEKRTLAPVKAEKPVASVTHLPVKKAAVRNRVAAEKKPAAPQVRKVANAKPDSDADREEF